MSSTSLDRTKLNHAGLGVFFRPRDASRLDISFPQLQRLVASGAVEKVAPALYRLAEVEPNEFETMAMVASAVPEGIICLLSALSVHGIGSQVPHQIWIALDRKARKPSHPPALLRVVRFSGPMLTYGVVVHPMLNVPAKVTSPARTVVDCFRYRHKIGIDVALDALRDVVRTRKATLDELSRAADNCHARTVLRPYLEMLVP